MRRPHVETVTYPSPRLANAMREEARRLGFALTWCANPRAAEEPVWYVTRAGAAPVRVGMLRDALLRFGPDNQKAARRHRAGQGSGR